MIAPEILLLLCTLEEGTLTPKGKYFLPKVCLVLVLNHFSRVRLFVTPWTGARQVSLSMGFSRQDYWSGLPFPSPGDLPNPEIEPTSPLSPAWAGRFFTASPSWEAHITCVLLHDQGFLCRDCLWDASRDKMSSVEL